MKFAVALLLLWILPIEVHAQSAKGKRHTAFPPDSGPWRPVLEYVIQSLALEIFRASTDSSATGWRVVLPDSTPAWQRFRTHLLMAVGGREPRPGDVTLDELTIDSLRVRGDTARVRLTRTHTQHCPAGGDTGFGNREEVFTVRFRESFWSAARSPRVAHGDRVGCR